MADKYPLTYNSTAKQFQELQVGDRLELGNGGLILTSPNGTRYRLTVDNSGNLGTTPAW